MPMDTATENPIASGEVQNRDLRVRILDHQYLAMQDSFKWADAEPHKTWRLPAENVVVF